jgi:hypothetical protein
MQRDRCGETVSIFLQLVVKEPKTDTTFANVLSIITTSHDILPGLYLSTGMILLKILLYFNNFG